MALSADVGGSLSLARGVETQPRRGRTYPPVTERKGTRGREEALVNSGSGREYRGSWRGRTGRGSQTVKDAEDLDEWKGEREEGPGSLWNPRSGLFLAKIPLQW